MQSVFGNRNIVVVKELTKIHEGSWRGTLSEAVEYHTQNPPKGEYVLILEGETPTAAAAEEKPTLEQAAALARALMEQGKPASAAAKEAAKSAGYPKGEIYKLITE